MEYALERVFRNEWNKGELEGKKEGKLEMAKKLLDSGVDISIVAKSSGISVEELKKLIEK